MKREIKIGSFYSQDIVIKTDIPVGEISDEAWRNKWQRYIDGLERKDVHRTEEQTIFNKVYY